MTEPEPKPLLTLAGELLTLWPDYNGLDGLDLQEMLAKHGLLQETKATIEDCKEQWAQEYDIEPGDTVYKLTELGKQACDAWRSKKDAEK